MRALDLTPGCPLFILFTFYVKQIEPTPRRRKKRSMMIINTLLCDGRISIFIPRPRFFSSHHLLNFFSFFPLLSVEVEDNIFLLTFSIRRWVRFVFLLHFLAFSQQSTPELFRLIFLDKHITTMWWQLDFCFLCLEKISFSFFGSSRCCWWNFRLIFILSHHQFEFN